MQHSQRSQHTQQSQRCHRLHPPNRSQARYHRTLAAAEALMGNRKAKDLVKAECFNVLDTLDAQCRSRDQNI